MERVMIIASVMMMTMTCGTGSSSDYVGNRGENWMRNLNLAPSGFSFFSVSSSKVNMMLSPQPALSPLMSKDNDTTTMSRLQRESILQQMGVWDPPWNGFTTSFKDDHHHDQPSSHNWQLDQTPSEVGNIGGERMRMLEGTMSRVKIIPDEHPVSAFLNKGVVKRFLFINDKFQNQLSITITPCTSVLLWMVKVWPMLDGPNGTTLSEKSHHLKTFRTQRSVSFTEPSAMRGVYTVDVRPIHSDSYVHLYASTFSSEPIMSPRTFAEATSEQFLEHIFTHVELKEEEMMKGGGRRGSTNIFLDEKNQVNTNRENVGGSSLANKPRIWAFRLRGNRIHVRWDPSPTNPHLMTYCIIVSPRKDFTSLCSASGERFGVLPPDLLHIPYYEETTTHHHHHRHRHGQTRPRRSTNNDILTLGCIGQTTNYILTNLQEGRLYHFNVFLRDSSTNMSYPYLRTTLKYLSPNKHHVPNSLRDGKPTKLKLFMEDPGKGLRILNSTVVKFNLNKPCSELAFYVLPCGGGPVRFEMFYNGSETPIYTSPSQVVSLDVVKVALPGRGKYSVRIHQANPSDWARMVEVFVGKKNRRLPLPRLPSDTSVSEEEDERTCDSVTLSWTPSPDARDNEYCIFLKEDSQKKRHYHHHRRQFKAPNQCDVERSLRTDPYVSHSLCVQKTLSPQEKVLLSHRIVGLQPGRSYIVQLILRRHNGKALSYQLLSVQTSNHCSEE